MAEISRIAIPVDAKELIVVGTGGTSKTKPSYVDGKRSDTPAQRDGADLHKLTGIAVSIGGQGVDGATVETLTPLENVESGAIFAAEGKAEVALRADGRPGFGDGGPRGVLAVTVYIERLKPVGNVSDLLRTKPSQSSNPGTTTK